MMECSAHVVEGLARYDGITWMLRLYRDLNLTDGAEMPRSLLIVFKIGSLSVRRQQSLSAIGCAKSCIKLARWSSCSGTMSLMFDPPRLV